MSRELCDLTDGMEPRPLSVSMRTISPLSEDVERVLWEVLDAWYTLGSVRRLDRRARNGKRGSRVVPRETRDGARPVYRRI